MVRQNRVENNGPVGIDFPISLPIPSVSEPQEGLVPIGDWGFYATPDKIDPRNCEFYPDSPWCGGNPLTREFASLDVEIVADECNIGIQITGSLGWIKTPERQIVYRRPECRLPDPPPFDDRPEPGTTTPQGFNRDIDPNTKVFAFIGHDSINRYVSRSHPSCVDAGFPSSFSAYSGKSGNVLRVICPGRPAVVSGRNVISKVSCEIQTSAFTNSYKAGSSSYADCFINKRTEYNTTEFLDYNDGALVYTYRFDDEGAIHSHTLKSTNNTTLVNENIVPTRQIEQCFLAGVPVTMVNGRWGDIQLLYNKKTSARLGWEYTNKCQFVIREDCSKVAIRRQPPPPPPPPEGCECMDCCPVSSPDLEEVKRMLRRLSQRVGVDQFPIAVPNSITEDNPGTTQIQDLAEFQHWFFHRFDEIVGRYPINSRIKDTDPAKEGDQSSDIELPNMAEAIAETFGLAAHSSINSELHSKMMVKLLVELTTVKQQVAKSLMFMDALFDYLGVELRDKQVDMESLISVGKTTVHELLEESTIKVDGVEYKSANNLQKDLGKLLHSAAVIKGAFWRKMDGNGDLKAQIIKMLRDKNAVSDRVNNLDDDDFSQFLEDLEIGFTNKTGISDSLNPYGKPMEQRPRIKEIGNTADTPTTDGQ